MGYFSEALGNFLLCLSPKTQAMKALSLFRYWLSRRAIDWKEYIGIITDSISAWPEGRGSCERRLHLKTRPHTCNPERRVGQMLPLLDPVLEKEQQREQECVRTYLPSALCRKSGYHTSLFYTVVLGC